jgi:hypothetical protein
MKRRVPLVLSLVLLVAAVWILHADTPDPVETGDTSTAQSTDAGMKIYIDPVTKEIVDAPVEPDWDIPSTLDGLNLSSEGLIEEDSPVSGKMVNLQGRFRHRYTATVDAEGKPVAGCDLPKSTQHGNSDSEEE